jgi:asparagine synthase (glutamine-hydrolysing)
MCGLFLVHSFTRPINVAAFAQALAKLKHRGPDDSGSFIADSAFFALGHQRLIINGGACAKQPFAAPDKSAPDKNWYAAVNGEIYNPRASLTARGMAFQTESDSEILLHLFMADGKAGLDALDGEFAFALWNQAKNISYLGRDPHGIKPLYYTLWQNQLIAASEIKALLEYGVPARWNLNYLINAENFIQAAHETLVENIYALAPGHVLEFDHNGVRITPFVSRSPLEPGRYGTLGNSSPMSFDEATGQFGALLEQAVIKRLSRTQKNAAYLSGGVDSGIISAIAAQHGPITAFTLGFEQEMLDESPAAQSLARALGIGHHLIRVGDQELADYFPAALYHAEMPVPNLNIAAKYFLSQQLQTAGFKVTLTGEGADESLLGYGYFRQDLTAPYTNQNWPADWLAEWRSIQARFGFIPAQIVRAAQHSQIYADLRSAGMQTVAGPTRPGQPAKLLAQVNASDELIRVAQHLHYHSCFQTYNLAALADRTEMAHGIEGRPPFLDKFLVDFIHRLPTDYKFRAGADGQFIDKAILRAAAKAWLPANYVQAPKKPFLAPATSLLREGPLAALFQHYFLGTEINIPLYDSQKIRAFYRMALTLPAQQQAMLDPVFVHLCSLCILQAQFGLMAL